MGNTIQFEYEFGTWHVFLEKHADLNIFLCHIECKRKMQNATKSCHICRVRFQKYRLINNDSASLFLKANSQNDA